MPRFGSRGSMVNGLTPAIVDRSSRNCCPMRYSASGGPDAQSLLPKWRQLTSGDPCCGYSISCRLNPPSPSNLTIGGFPVVMVGRSSPIQISFAGGKAFLRLLDSTPRTPNLKKYKGYAD